ncbi:MAG: hypothetical protein HN837_01450 [Chloroflexi bacterium]|nr:hypothetical protein [Chloroflexota bacterium]
MDTMGSKDGSDIVGFLIGAVLVFAIPIPLAWLCIWAFGSSALGWAAAGASIGLGIGVGSKVFKKYTGRE